MGLNQFKIVTEVGFSENSNVNFFYGIWTFFFWPDEKYHPLKENALPRTVSLSVRKLIFSGYMLYTFNKSFPKTNLTWQRKIMLTPPPTNTSHFTAGRYVQTGFSYEGVSKSFGTGRLARELWYSSLPLGELYHYFMSQSSKLCRHNPLCCFSTSVCCKRIFRYRLSPETFGYTPRIWRIGGSEVEIHELLTSALTGAERVYMVFLIPSR
jgi:hypothetical protein